MNDKILVINCGSSSLKFSVFDSTFEMPEQKLICAGIFESLDLDKIATYTYKLPDEEGKMKKIYDDVKMEPKTTHHDAILKMTELLLDEGKGVIKDLSEITAIGHRVVQGGDVFTESTLIDDDVVNEIRDLIPLAPLHNPAHITGIEICREVFGKDLPQVAVFDNAFHSTMPAEAYTFPIPYELAQKHSIRRYGFHGTSHKFVSTRCAEIMGKGIEDLKIITCHLGNGSSITAVKNGKVIDTTMGLTPLDGVIMGTRCGNIDPSVVLFIMKKENLSVKEMDTLLNKNSGYLGISGLSSDDRDVKDEAETNEKGLAERCKLARNILAYDIKKYIGAFTAAMDGIDAIVLTGGIGENADDIRAKVCKELTFLGIEIDEEYGKTLIKGIEGELSTENSKVKVYVIPTNEELAIARDTINIIGGKNGRKRNDFQSIER